MVFGGFETLGGLGLWLLVTRVFFGGEGLGVGFLV